MLGDEGRVSDPVMGDVIEHRGSLFSPSAPRSLGVTEMAERELRQKGRSEGQGFLVDVERGRVKGVDDAEGFVAYPEAKKAGGASVCEIGEVFDPEAGCPRFDVPGSDDVRGDVPREAGQTIVVVQRGIASSHRYVGRHAHGPRHPVDDVPEASKHGRSGRRIERPYDTSESCRPGEDVSCAAGVKLSDGEDGGLQGIYVA